jgi:hypothetical protein
VIDPKVFMMALSTCFLSKGGGFDPFRVMLGDIVAFVAPIVVALDCRTAAETCGFDRA